MIVDGRDLTALDANRTARGAPRDRHDLPALQPAVVAHGRIDNVALPLELAGKTKAEIAATVLPLLDLVGLSALRDRYPGADQRRAEAARGHRPRAGQQAEGAALRRSHLRARTPRPRAPSSTCCKQINRELGLTIVLITHQMEVIKQVCDRVAVLEAGEVVETGRAIDVFLRPQHDVTRALIGDVIAQELPASDAQARAKAGSADGPRPLCCRLGASRATNVDQPVLARDDPPLRAGLQHPARPYRRDPGPGVRLAGGRWPRASLSRQVRARRSAYLRDAGRRGGGDRAC